IVIISQGKIVADGSAENLKQSTGGKNLMKLSVQNTDFKTVQEALSDIPGLDDITRVSETDGLLNVNLNYSSTADLRPEVYRRIKETDWVLLEFHQETQSLENIFRELTKEN
ncbi:MAG: hypothetical protein JRF36_06335, partial [Deltaproteobacteria bacterium]|nr:hypothetical protein [Deltaproteobacteria bacterium]